MRHNPVLKKLGFTAADRVIVIHVDDIGMCQATLPAFRDLVEAEIVSSGSVMVPCPWFPEAARLCREHPSIDIGIHLTLTSEWSGYRWKPISTCDVRSGLIDAEGYFYRNQSLWQRPDPQVICNELLAQINQARKAGMTLTHIDCHMFATLDRRLAGKYVRAGFELGLPVLMVRQPQWVEILSEQAISEWEEEGLPVFDHLREMYLTRPAEDRFDQAKEVFDTLPQGLTFFMLHPAQDTPELRAITDDWQQRVADYETFMSAKLRDHVRRSGVRIIGWRTLQGAMLANR